MTVDINLSSALQKYWKYSKEVLELFPQPTAAHITITEIIFTKFYYKTIFTKLYFKEN